MCLAPFDLSGHLRLSRLKAGVPTMNVPHMHGSRERTIVSWPHQSLRAGPPDTKLQERGLLRKEHFQVQEGSSHQNAPVPAGARGPRGGLLHGLLARGCFRTFGGAPTQKKKPSSIPVFHLETSLFVFVAMERFLVARRVSPISRIHPRVIVASSEVSTLFYTWRVCPNAKHHHASKSFIQQLCHQVALRRGGNC